MINVTAGQTVNIAPKWQENHNVNSYDEWKVWAKRYLESDNTGRCKVIKVYDIEESRFEHEWVGAGDHARVRWHDDTVSSVYLPDWEIV